MSEPRYIERPPRIQPQLPRDEVEIPSPPDLAEDSNQSLLQMGLPLLTIMGYLLISVFGRGRSLLLILPMGIAVIASVGVSLYVRHQNKKKKAEKQAAYAERLIELRKEMVTNHDMQRRFYRYNYPDPATVVSFAASASPDEEMVHSNGHVVSRLWERRTGDADFGMLRLGLGTAPSTCVFKLSSGGSFDDPQMRDAMRLAEDSRFVEEVPITIPLRGVSQDKSSTQGLMPRHSIGITGENTPAVYSFVWSLLAHYTTFHAPTDARLLVLGLDSARQGWRWTGALPHCQEGQGSQTLCFEDDADRQNDKERSKVYAFMKSLRQVLDERKLRLQDKGSNQEATLPFLLLVVDLLAPVPDGSLLGDWETDPAISLLLQEGRQLGAAVIFLVPDRNQVPSGCQSLIEVNRSQLDNGPTAPANVSFRYAEVGVNTPRYIGRADQLSDQAMLAQYARQLEPLMVRKSYGADLPASVTMMGLLKVETIEELQQQTLENWQRSQQMDQADWLKVALGMLSGGDVRRLKFSADADGVHGLIAGSTGSGKSELLMTMIMGLALNYDPSIINFVLVDFKGGAAFEPFRKLPHCVDIVTNLKGSAVERMFAAITAELNRRQAINVATDSKHIVHYRQRGLHQPPYGRSVTIKGEKYSTAPYPHLFVFIDEFAEMIAENPEYKAQLNSITRLGRALGVTLILAAQRPTGVTDQMRANIKFRIALRVETREESSEVLRRPDAAYLPTGVPGRGYLQVGNENIEMLQIAWTGGEYRGGRPQEKPKVIWHNRPRKSHGAIEAEELPKVYEVMVDMMADLAQAHSLLQRKPWPDFLMTDMSLQTPVDISYISPESLNLIIGDGSGEKEAGENSKSIPLNAAITQWLQGEGAWMGIDWETRAMRAVAGIIDNPYNSEQLPLLVDFRRGHAAIFGASGWGKTTFLRTLLASLTTTHSPEEFHVYILDFGGRQLNVFRELPHVGAIITPDEEERVQRLLRKLDNLLEQRKRLLSDAGADDLYSYNNNHPGSILPAVLVVVDNFAQFREGFENLMPLLISLARESRAYGIHFAVSAEQPAALSGKLYNLFSERMTLKLSDPTEYTAIVGRGARAIGDIPGRGFVKVERRALEFQTALPVGSDGNMQHLDETQKLAALVRVMAGAEASIPAELLPTAVSTLANRVLLNNLLPVASSISAVPPRIQPALGIDDLNLEPWLFDLPRQGPHCIIIGPPSSGKTTTLRSLVLSLAYSYAPGEVMLVLADFQQRFYRYGGQYSLGDLPHVMDVLSHEKQLAEFVENLKTECALFESNRGRRRPIFVVIDNYDGFSDDARSQREIMPALAVLAREYGTDGLHFVIAGSPGITRAAEELRKQVQAPRYGLALQADAVDALNGRIPRSLAQAELPLGRSFLVKSGRTLMLQIATPYDDDEQIEASLDGWVATIRDRYPGQQAVWSRQPEGVAGDEAATADGQPAAAQQGAIDVTAGIDLEALKRQLQEKANLPEAVLAAFGATDLINMARRYGILETE